MSPEDALNQYVNGLLGWWEFTVSLEHSQRCHPSGIWHLREMTDHMDSIYNGLRKQNVERMLLTWPLAKVFAEGAGR